MNIPEGRRKLVAVVQQGNDLIQVDDVTSALSVGRKEAAKLLSRWTIQGWLRRVGRGFYTSVPIDLLEHEHVLEDPWVLIPPLYDPAYVGGWTAAEFWGLTDQLSLTIFVMTVLPVRSKRQIRHGTRFELQHIQERHLFGTIAVWRKLSKVRVSDVNRTMVDILNSPSVGGGSQHMADCLSSYLRHEERNDDLFVEYAKKLGNGAIFKRLGFLLELHPEAETLAENCRQYLTTGYAKLDPKMECSRLITRWRLWVPKNWTV